MDTLLGIINPQPRRFSCTQHIVQLSSVLTTDNSLIVKISTGDTRVYIRRFSR